MTDLLCVLPVVRKRRAMRRFVRTVLHISTRWTRSCPRTGGVLYAGRELTAVHGVVQLRPVLRPVRQWSVVLAAARDERERVHLPPTTRRVLDQHDVAARSEHGPGRRQRRA